ncbi:uncharacterized protein BDZ99DRAFT_576404 [Mytilinidion resinicola]|uniref:Protein-S-isoprenylcysteine O-methyltransferase n=1 Tax=Mytilinidion resinicola TaxID=574789 RepID=A0A6A6Y2V9_9PEZI|nr:uncharacterized protein BDZ99DRAFT_576404 [Mytilinidion resinicola]KAF2803151.1 hypothetical protein BDZ99DRAFT_576404 [Mytilinidion resinicola]
MPPQTTYPSASAISYTATLLLAMYLNHRATTPPVPLTTTKSTNDEIFTRTGGFSGLRNYRWFMATLFLSQAACALLFNTTSFGLLCPNPNGPNPALLAWSPQSAVYLATIIIFCSLRLGAYRNLGSSFTYMLTVPKNGLVTTGIYRYVQHPSYVAYFISTVGVVLLTWRVDGAAACWVRPGTGLWVANAVFNVGYGMALFFGFGVRVRDEEKFLKGQFGREWEAWHQKTARFVPFVW